jgi:hypothetical protein
MIPSLRELLGRVDRLSGRLGRLGDDLRTAIVDAERDSVASAIRARRVLDHIIRDVFERHVNEPAGTRPMEQLLTRIVKDGDFPDELAGFAQAVKGLANRVAHDVGRSYPVRFLEPTLGQLLLIVEWYVVKVGGEADSIVAEPEPPGEAETVRPIGRGHIKSFSRLRVYLCSASEDLREHQRSAEQVIGEEGWLTVRLEDAGPVADLLGDALRRGVEGSDLVLLIAGHRRGFVPTPAQGGDGERSVAELVLEAARRRGIPVRALLAGKGWPKQARESEPGAAERVVRLREALAPFAATIDAATTPDEFGDGVPRPGLEFGSMVRAVLRDHRDRTLDGAAGRPDPSASARRSRAAGAEVFLPRLETLVGGLILPRLEIARAYRESAPPGWDPPSAERNPIVLLLECARSLARAPRQRGDGVIPLVRFVGLISDHVGGEPASGLRAWIDETLNRIAIDADDEAWAKHAHGPREDDPRPDESHHLLVQVTPRLCERGLYSVKAWLFGTEDPACIRPGEEKVARDDLPAYLGTLLKELSRFDAATDRTWVELLLPRELLCSDVDQWRVGLDFIEDIPIGVEHRLIVRSLERSSHSRAVQALQDRWRAVRRRIEARCRLADAVLEDEGDGGLALWIGRDDCGGAPLYAALKDAKVLVAAVLGCTPQADPRDPSRDVLNTLFQAGVPVVVWSRQLPDGGGAAVREALTALLDVGPFRRLPDRVWDLRKRAACSGAVDHDLGRHLTLLWDDPSRSSPDFDSKHRFQAPTPAGSEG